MSFSLLYVVYSFILSDGSLANVSSFDFLVTALVDPVIVVIIAFIFYLLLISNFYINVKSKLAVKVMIGALITHDAYEVCVKGHFWWWIIIPDVQNNSLTTISLCAVLPLCKIASSSLLFHKEKFRNKVYIYPIESFKVH